MPINLQSEEDGRLLHIQFTGKLKKEDYFHFVPDVDEAIGKHRQMRMLVEMNHFHGWELGAAWEDFKLGVRHFNHIDRITLIGDKKWEQWMATLCKPFTRAELRYFAREHSEQAHDWISGKPS